MGTTEAKHFKLCYTAKKPDPMAAGEWVDVAVEVMGCFAKSKADAAAFFEGIMGKKIMKQFDCWIREDSL